MSRFPNSGGVIPRLPRSSTEAGAFALAAMHAQFSQIPPVLVPDVFGLKFLVGGEAAVLNEILT